MIKTKKGVRFGVMTETIIYIFNILFKVSLLIKKTIIITSGNDSKHRVGSKHFKDEALDIRVFNLNLKKILLLCWKLREYPKVGLILFEWHYYIEGQVTKYKIDFNNTESFKEIVEKYYSCKSCSKVGHLHVEFIKGDLNG